MKWSDFQIYLVFRHSYTAHFKTGPCHLTVTEQPDFSEILSNNPSFSQSNVNAAI